jgi:hypothetical protein
MKGAEKKERISNANVGQVPAQTAEEGEALGIVGSGECRVQKRGGALGTQVEEEAGGEWRRRAPRARKISRR